MSGPAPRSSLRLGLLGGGCLAAALVIAAAIAMRIPLPELPPAAAVPAASAPAAIAPPTIVLASEPVEAPAEELRAEMLALAADLLGRFGQVPEALHVAAQLKDDLHETTEAIAIWQKCIELAPRQPGPYAGQATALMALGNDDEAAALLRQALARGCSAPDIHRQLAAALTKLGELDAAEDALRTGMQSFEPTAEDWRQLGQVQLEAGRYEAAEASLRQALERGLGSDNVLFSLATACARQGKDEEAGQFRDRFTRLRETQANSPVQFQDRYDMQMRRIAVLAMVNGAAVYDHHGQPAQAERLLLRANALAPESAAVVGELAGLCHRQGRTADALVAQRQALLLEPKVPGHYVNVASLAMLAGDQPLAEATLKTLIAARPDVAIGYCSLARLYLQTGQADQARWFAEAALKQPAAPEESVTAYLVLAAACEEAGEARAAQEAIAAARRLSPGDPRLQEVAP